MDALATLTNLTILHWVGNGTSDIGGLAPLVNLDDLVLDVNSIGDISPLSGLTALTNLSLEYNQVSDVSAIGALGDLVSLDLNHNSIAGINGWTGLTSLQTLRIAHNLLANTTGLAGLSALQTLDVSHNLIVEPEPANPPVPAALAGLTDLQQLRHLDAGYNQVVNLTPLTDLTALQTLFLGHNAIVTLRPLLDNTGLASGDEVVVTGNDLNEDTLCLVILELLWRGVYVVGNDPCPDSDSDADGFTNGEELRYLQLFIADLETLHETYLDWIADFYKRPPSDSDHLDDTMACIPKTTVTVAVQGEGIVYPPPGTREFATYALNDDPSVDPCDASPSWSYNTMILTAAPAPGWIFREWLGVRLQTQTGPTLAITLDQPDAVCAEFVYRPGIEDLDLVADLTYALGQWGIGTAISAYDMNGMGPETDANSNPIVVRVANRIPDAAEFYLLETILKDIYLDLSSIGGASHDDVWAAWQTNLTKVQAVLGDADPEDEPYPERIARVIAAYMTLGDNGSVLQATTLVHEHYPIVYLAFTASLSRYDITARKIAARDDADMDGFQNIEEWDSTSGMDWLDRLPAYAARALGQEATQYTRTASAADECDADCIYGEHVSVMPILAGSGEAALWPERFYDDNGATVRRGIDVLARATPNAEGLWHFYRWYAEGTTIDYSEEPVDDFLMMLQPAALTAWFSRAVVEVPEDSEWCTITAEPPAIETHWGGEDGARVFIGLDNEPLTLTAVAPEGKPPVYAWTATSFNGSEDQHLCWGNKVHLFPGLAGFAGPLTGDVPRACDLVAAQALASPFAGGYVAATAAGGQPEWCGWGTYWQGVICPKEGWTIHFIAIAKPGYHFIGWYTAGHRESLAEHIYYAPLGVPDGLTARFEKKHRSSLSLHVTGCGWLDCSAKMKYVPTDTEVTLEAHPANCYPTAGQTGHACCSGFKQWVGTALGQDSLCGDALVPISQLKSASIRVQVHDVNTDITAVFSDAAKEGSNGNWQPMALPCQCGHMWLCPNHFLPGGDPAYCNSPGQDIPGICLVCRRANVVRDSSIPNLPYGRGLLDDCDNNLGIVCGSGCGYSDPHYILCYNSNAISFCQYVPGSNAFRYQFTGTAGYRFANVLHLNACGVAQGDESWTWTDWCIDNPTNYKIVEFDCIKLKRRIRYYKTPEGPRTLQQAMNATPVSDTDWQDLRSSDSCQLCDGLHDSGS